MQPVNDQRFVAARKARGVTLLTTKHIWLLEVATCLSSEEKVRLLALLAHQRWLTEVDVRKERIENDQAITNLLDRLGLAWTSKHYVKKEGSTVYWVEVGVNSAVLSYLKKNRDRLSVLEAGILYGYPVTAVLACSGIIAEKRRELDQKTPVERYLGGIFSRVFEDEESSFLKRVWENLGSISPKIIAQAEEDCRKKGNYSTGLPKELNGAILDKPIRLTQVGPINAAQIETGPKGVPAIVAESSKAKG